MMHALSRKIWVLALLTAGAAQAADPPTATLTAQGHADTVCNLGDWVKDSGPGSFSGGKAPVVSYGDADLVDGSSRSIVGSGSAVKIHAPLLCNTALTWSLSTAKGAFRLDSGATAPSFANQWLYDLVFGPYSSSGARIGSFEDMTSDGTPFSGDAHGMSLANSLKITRFGMTFSPLAQSATMMAGSYSETVTLTMTPLY